MLFIESQYLMPVCSIKILSNSMHIGIPLYEKFRKMSFQNRCIIPTANGPVHLTVPLHGGRENSLPLGQVRIDNSQRWQVRHWRTLTAAYNRSPFFEFHAGGLELLYGTRFELLHEWNHACLSWLVKQFGLTTRVEELSGPVDGELALRVLPRNFQDPGLLAGLPVYTQVFQERTGFIPNMSSIDLLFCAGKGAVRLLNG